MQWKKPRPDELRSGPLVDPGCSVQVSLRFALVHDERNLGVDPIPVNLAIFYQGPVVVYVQMANVIDGLGGVLVGVFRGFFNGVSFGEDLDGFGDRRHDGVVVVNESRRI